MSLIILRKFGGRQILFKIFLMACEKYSNNEDKVTIYGAEFGACVIIYLYCVFMCAFCIDQENWLWTFFFEIRFHKGNFGAAPQIMTRFYHETMQLYFPLLLLSILQNI